MGWVALIGALTALFAASIGFFQYDIKKVLAYSTVSQLGFMFIGVGVGAYWAGVYHLMTHAFFKATLFLGSGSVILGCHHEQDMRKMGGLKKYMPITRWTYLFACIAIAGFPIANGFYSKDEILWKAFTSRHLELFGAPAPWLGPLIYVVGILAATGTAFYMYRSYYMTFTGEYRGGAGHHDEHNVDPARGGRGEGVRALARGPRRRRRGARVRPRLARALARRRQAPHGEPRAGRARAHGHGAAAPRGARRTTTTTRTATATTAARRTSRPGPSRSSSRSSRLARSSRCSSASPAAWTHTAPLLEHWLEPVAPRRGPVRATSTHVWEYAFQGVRRPRRDGRLARAPARSTRTG